MTTLPGIRILPLRQQILFIIIITNPLNSAISIIFTIITMTTTILPRTVSHQLMMTFSPIDHRSTGITRLIWCRISRTSSVKTDSPVLTKTSFWSIVATVFVILICAIGVCTHCAVVASIESVLLDWFEWIAFVPADWAVANGVDVSTTFFEHLANSTWSLTNA